MAKLGFRELKREVNDTMDKHPRLKDHQAFAVWFLRAYGGAPEEAAVEALPGPNREKGVDAVWIDEDHSHVFVIQSKFHKSLMSSREGREVVNFSDLAGILAGPKQKFDDFCDQPNPMDPAARAKLEKARERVRRGYRLQLCYVSTGRCAVALEREAIRNVRRVRAKHDEPGRFAFFDGNRIIGLLYEWLDGASPPVPSLDLPLEAEPIKKTDRGLGITTWVFWMQGNAVANMYREGEVRVFHRNIRGYLGLGDSAINRAMLQTIKKDPQNFVYLNNGVTVICDAAVREENGGGNLLNVTNPQIINGQQTTRVLAEAGNLSKKADVLVRVIQLPTSMKLSGSTYEDLVGDIVEATNHQNAIKSTDLRANDRVQVHLERELGKLNYFYVRKRQAPAEVRPLASQAKWIIKKEDFARAVGACISEGLPRRVGIDRLFREDETYYEQIFKTDNPFFYLCRWWLFRLVSSGARGSGERQWAKFVVMHFLWDQLGADLSRRARAFVAACENPRRHRDLQRALAQAIDDVYKSAIRYYRTKRGTGRDRVEVSPFFKRREVYDGFERYWRSRANRSRSDFNGHVRTFREELHAA